MTNPRLPQGLIPQGSSPTFTEETLPDAIRNDHALGPRRWGVLQLLEGSITYIDLIAGEEHALKAPDLMTIAPKSPHKVQPGNDPFRFRVDFFVEEGGEPLREKEFDCQDAVRESFERCEATSEFANKFYEVFLSSSPEIAPFFANTDFDKQRKLLRGSVYIMVSREVSDPKARDMLRRIGQTHSRSQYNIPPVLYELWLESLCNAVAQLDPMWDEAIEQAWRNRMQAGIQLITAAY